MIEQLYQDLGTCNSVLLKEKVLLKAVQKCPMYFELLLWVPYHMTLMYIKILTPSLKFGRPCSFLSKSMKNNLAKSHQEIVMALVPLWY